MNAYNVDFAKMTITITADFAKKMNTEVSRREDKEKKEKKKKRQQSDLELMVFRIMEQSMKKALDAALDDIFKTWK